MNTIYAHLICIFMLCSCSGGGGGGDVPPPKNVLLSIDSITPEMNAELDKWLPIYISATIRNGGTDNSDLVSGQILITDGDGAVSYSEDFSYSTVTAGGSWTKQAFANLETGDYTLTISVSSTTGSFGGNPSFVFSHFCVYNSFDQ